MLTIAIDYDNTFSADPERWADVIRLLRGDCPPAPTGAAAHTVICVSSRSPGALADAVHVAFAEQGLNVPVVLAGNQYKRKAAKQAGYEVDIWIDDMPAMIDTPCPFTVRHMLPDDGARRAFAKAVVG